MKSRYTLICFVLLPSVIMLLLIPGCGVISPTPMPPYIHYTPSKASNIHLEFDYPNSWTFSEETQDADFMVIGLGDPRIRTLPTPSPDDSPTPHDFGAIMIWIIPSEPSRTPDNELESLKQDYSNDFRIILLKDYMVIIDGYNAGVLEYLVEPADYPSVMFNRRIIFIVKDQIYEILFEIAEKERGGEFEQGYDYFFNSLKILP